ncbi:hypothetical protein ACJ41O_005627 [Fusarium nematophilum]
MEKSRTNWVVIFAGYANDLEQFFTHNEGLASRVPHTIDFHDFSEQELGDILSRLIEKKYKGKMKVEGGFDGLYMKIAIKRLFRGAGRRGCGNARSVENLLFTIRQRQAERLRSIGDPSKEEMRLLTKEDLIGPCPSNVMSNNPAWAKLQSMIGLGEVKMAVRSMFDTMEENYQRELKEKKPLPMSFNRIFVGSPGTGKTTVAKLYGRVLADLGFLSSGDVVVKNPSDFIGEAVGKSEANTKAILASTRGKVLIIDEAYMLDPGDSSSTRDSYKTAVLDMIVAEVQNVPGDERCVILVGYPDKMMALFENANPGLAGRFMIDHPFRFVDYNMTELEEILHLAINSRDVTLADDALEAARGVLSSSKMRENFSNARAVSNLVLTAISRYQGRQQGLDPSSRSFSGILEPRDFDPRLGLHNESRAKLDCRVDLKDKVSVDIINKLCRIQTVYQQARENGWDPLWSIPTKFVFRGPTG